jgi:uncharacterized protein
MTINNLFLDTSGLMCLIDKADLRHQKAVNLFNDAQKLFITNYVLTEFLPLATSRKLPRKNAILFLKNLVLLPRIETFWIDENTHERAMELTENRLDKGYSLCDSVSFVVMREREMTEALTTDKHFVQEGFIALLK